MVLVKLTNEEVHAIKDALYNSVYFAPSLDNLSSEHPGDIVEWGKQLHLTGLILLKLKEAQNGEKKSK